MALLDSISTLQRRLSAGQVDRLLIIRELDSLVSSFPRQDPGMGVQAIVASYREALFDAPAWAVHAARQKFVRGGVPGLSQTFAPSPPEFAGIVREILRPFRQDLADLVALAAIEPTRDPETKERITEGFAELRGSMTREPKPQDGYAAAEQALKRRAAANGKDGTIELNVIQDAKPLPSNFKQVNE